MKVLLAGEVEKRQLGALLKILAILVLKLRGQRIKDDLKPIADTQLKEAKTILKKLGADIKLFDEMYGMILKKSETVYPLAEAFVKDFRRAMREKNLKNDLENVTVKQNEVMGYILTLISSPDSSSAYSSLQRRISNLGDVNINKRFIEFHTETGSSPDAIRDQIYALVKKLTGRKDSMALTADENKKFADNDDKKEISKLRSSYSEAVRQKVKQIVLNSGKQQIPVATVMKTLKSDGGTSITPYPAIFLNSKHVYVNLDAVLCNVNGDPLAQKSMSPTFKFELNPDYDPTITTKGKGWLYKVTNPETGLANYIGTIKKSAEAKGAKFDKLSDILSSGEIDAIKRKWRSDMNAKDIEKFETVAAFMTEYLYVTSSRIGSEEKGGKSGDVTTWGASQFPVKSVKIPTGDNPTKLRVAYFVKGGHNVTFLIDASKSSDNLDKQAKIDLIKFILAKCKGKKPTDPVFSVGGLTPAKRIQPTAYTNWLKAKTTLTAHNFRTLRGTEVALTVLPGAKKEVMKLQAAVKPKKLADAKVHEVFKGAMTRVGEILGHIRRNKEGVEESTANTAIAYYCNPDVMLKWYSEVGTAPPTTVVAAARRAAVDI